MFLFKRNFCELKMNIQQMSDAFLSDNEDDLKKDETKVQRYGAEKLQLFLRIKKS